MTTSRPRGRLEHLVGGACLFAISLISVSPAQAQPAKPACSLVVARNAFDEAVAAIEKGDQDEACRLFDISMSACPRVSTQLNVARCHTHYGKLVAAKEDYERVLTMVVEDKGMRAKEKEKHIEMAHEAIDQLVLRIPKLIITVDEQPVGLEITRNGEPFPLGLLGKEVPLDPGLHTIVAAARDSKIEHSAKVTLEEGKTETVSLSLKPPPPPPPPPPPKPEPEPELLPAWLPAWTLISAGAGLALVGVGIGFEVDSAAAEQELISHCGDDSICEPSEVSDGYDPEDDNAHKNRSYGVFVALTVLGSAGIGAAAIGIAVPLLSGEASAPDEQISLVPIVSPAAQGLGIAGRF